ncbi:hypothetical protein ABZU94_24320 [Streptomyces mirabilis]|uniref:hypothetical protein n=1 Tax=Streptomyces sp. NPDC005388 TaxID=3156717 RepID=UPI0033BB2F7A
MSTPFEPVVFRPLPRPLKPFPQETESSFLNRLATANAIPVQRLKQPSRWLTSRLDPIDRLSVLSGQPRTAIQYAIPHWENKAWNVSNRPLALTPRWACRRCVARRTGTPEPPVMVWRSKYHDQVCTPHRLWIGRAVENPGRQFDLIDLPDVVQAQQRHYRLLRRHGPAVITACYEHCSSFWHSLFQRGYRLSDRAERLRQMSTRDHHVRPWEPQRYAAVYPEIVEAMSLYASPHWRRLAQSAHQFGLFRAEFNRRLPQENALRTTARQWFLIELMRIAHRIERSIEAAELKALVAHHQAEAAATEPCTKGCSSIRYIQDHGSRRRPST